MLKKAMFGLFDVIFWFYGKIKQLRFRAWLPVSNIILKQSPPFCTKKRNNRPSALIWENMSLCMVDTKASFISLLQ